MVLITHAHFDHVGALPILCRRFADKLDEIPIYCTPLTRDITRVILEDSVRVQKAQAESNPFYAVTDIAYDEEDAAAAVDAMLELPPYSKITRAYPDRGVIVTVQPVAAGHIVGAASFLVTMTRVANGRPEQLLLDEAVGGWARSGESIRFALLGDIGDDCTLAIDSVDAPSLLAFRPHIVVTESTYGSETLPAIEEERDRLRRAVAMVVREGGKVIIPAFALGRSTEVALIIRNANMRWLDYCAAMNRKPDEYPNKNDPVWDLLLTDLTTRWEQYCARTGHDIRFRPPTNDSIWDEVDKYAMLPYIPCYLDGMIRPVTTICEHHRHALSSLVQRNATSGGAITDARALIFLYHPMLKRRMRNRPYVVVTTSGMITAGPVLRWITELGTNPANALFLSGYQDEESPGAAAKRLADSSPNERKLTINGEKYPLALAVSWFRLRAHAAPETIARLMSMLAPDHVVFAHGDPDAIAALRKRTQDLLNTGGAVTQTWSPKNLDDLVLPVNPERSPETEIDLWRATADRSVELLMRGTNIDRVVQSLRASPRATDTPRDLSLDVFGVQRDSLKRRIAIRCVSEVLEDNEGTWFHRRNRDGYITWEARRAATIELENDQPSQTNDSYWDAVDIPPAEPGIAVVRYRSHYPRLALIGPPECPDTEVIHPAVVALTREQRVRARDVVLPISSAPIGMDAWGSSDKWASLMRRVLTDLQLGAEAMLNDAEWKRDLLQRNALDATAVAERRNAWDTIVETTGSIKVISEEGLVVLSALRDAVIGSGIATTVSLSLRQLRSMLTDARILFPADGYEIQFARILTGVNDARSVLGMAPVEASRLIVQYPFDVRQVVAAIDAIAPQADPGTRIALDETERIAFALYQADVFIRVTHGDMLHKNRAKFVEVLHEAEEPTYSLALSETDGVI